VFVDRLHVKPVMITSDLTRGVLILGLPRATTLWQVCTIFVVLAVISSFFQPAQSITIRTIVPMDKLLAANAMMSKAFYVVRLLSPVAAGALVEPGTLRRKAAVLHQPLEAKTLRHRAQLELTTHGAKVSHI
jgi:DHA3 family macrolide efflux protein-like MFS transporter